MLQVRKVSLGSGQPKICVSLTGKNKDELLVQAEKAYETAAEIIEWRADYFESVSVIDEVIDALKIIRGEIGDKVLMFTFRTKEEGGFAELNLHGYHGLCVAAASSKQIDMIDVELLRVEYLGRDFLTKLKAHGVKIVMSIHDFEKTPDDATLVFRINVMNQFGADIGKIAMMPNHMQDVLRLMGIIKKVRAFNQLPLAVIAMGDLGKVTRISGELTNSIFTFGCLDEASAPGQIPVAQLKEMLDTLKLSE